MNFASEFAYMPANDDEEEGVEELDDSDLEDGVLAEVCCGCAAPTRATLHAPLGHHRSLGGPSLCVPEAWAPSAPAADSNAACAACAPRACVGTER